MQKETIRLKHNINIVGELAPTINGGDTMDKVLHEQYNLTLLNDKQSLVHFFKDQIMRVYYQECGGVNPYYVYIKGIYEIGNEVWILTRDYNSESCSLRRFSEIDTIEFYEEDQNMGEWYYVLCYD